KASIRCMRASSSSSNWRVGWPAPDGAVGCGDGEVDIPLSSVLSIVPSSCWAAIVAWMSERFYVNWPLSPGPVVVEGPEAHHLAGVCRVHAGDAVCLFNGDGREYPARVLAAGRRTVTLEVAATCFPPPGPPPALRG